MNLRFTYAKFFRGVLGAQNFRNNGNQEGEKTYPQYRELTTDSLEKVIHYANICLNVPFKRYFRADKYNTFQSACEIYKNAAEDILKPERDADQNILNQGLEAERHRLMNDPSCARDLDNCVAYDDVTTKINNINDRVNVQLSQL